MITRGLNSGCHPFIFFDKICQPVDFVDFILLIQQFYWFSLVVFGCPRLLFHRLPSSWPTLSSPSISWFSFIMSLSNFRFWESGCFLLVFIVFSDSIITTVNNNIYNYGDRYKKKHKLLNQISKWKKKEKLLLPIELLRDILLLLLRVLLLRVRWGIAWNHRTKWKKKNKIKVPKWTRKQNCVLLWPKNQVLLRLKNEVPKWKKKNTNLLRVQPTHLLLLLPFLVTMATYTVNAKELQGVVLCFQYHHDTVKFPYIHRTLNTVYGLDLYETECEFIFHDDPTNGLTELYMDSPQRLLDHTITHIQTESGATSTRSETNKVDKLFKTMLLIYKKANEAYVYFKRRSRTSGGNPVFCQESTPWHPVKVFGDLVFHNKNLPVSKRYCGWSKYGQVI